MTTQPMTGPSTEPSTGPADGTIEGRIINAVDWPDLLATPDAEHQDDPAGERWRECAGCGTPFDHDGVPGRPGLLYCAPECEADDRDDDDQDDDGQDAEPIEPAAYQTRDADPGNVGEVDDRQDHDDDRGQSGEDDGEAPAWKAMDVELVGLAMLTRTLSQAAGVDPVLVTLRTDLPEGGGESSVDPCHRDVVRISLDAALLDQSTRLCGVQAHEIAHQALGHSTRPRPWRRGARMLALLMGVGLPIVISYSLWWMWAAALTLAGLFYLIDAAQARKEEKRADVLASRLLTRVGRDGFAITTATLAASPADGLAFRLVGWIFSSYPTRRARLRAVAAASPQQRPSLATIAQRSDTALRGSALRTVRVMAGLLSAAAVGPLWLHDRFSAMFGLSGMPLLVIYGGVAAAVVATAYNAYRGRPGPLLAYAVLAITAVLTFIAAVT
ncbi:M48 family metalloprotease [Nonomuraea typhae]|uniref:M48 family metalloprotease n=1 Tax=Nonomuraea typhae TaxID=2603600 RepID=UPI0012F8D0CF|nr:M48 family metalloprotease [Nonomuraea typhae]